MRDNNDLGNNSFMWIFALLILMYGGNGFGFGGGRGPMFPNNYATQEQMTAGFNNQATQNQLQQIALSSANNNYETAQLINGQTNAMMQQSNTNLVNAIQGYNQINLTIQNQTNVLSQQLQALQAKMDSCCCEIKAQMLQDKLNEQQIQNANLRSDISNFQQSQYILGQTGRWVGWATSGSQASGTT
jgi:hypothetical protein